MPNSVRKLNHTVSDLSTMKSGLSLNMGEANDAYVAYSRIPQRIEAGDTLVGSYEIRGEGDERYAHILSVDEVIPAKTEETAPDFMSATVDIKNIQPADAGYVMWSKNPNHRRPTFVPFSALKGINIFKAAKVKVDFHQTDANRLVVSAIKVVETK